MLTAFRRAAPIALLLAALLPALCPQGARAADGIAAIDTTGSGMLTMCRSWVLFHTCHNYNNVALPNRITVGDSLPLSFGSNPKDYTFPVARIARDGDSCTVMSEAAGDSGNADKIEVASCRDPSGTH